jgi:hypothetical protein
MRKIDLIIDALELASHVPRGVMYPAGYHMQIAQALAAARELKALQPVVKVIAEDGGVCFELLDKKLPVGTKLYALDEATK